MADLELRDTSGNIIAELQRNHSYPWPQSYAPNVAVGKTVGWKARSSRRGSSLLVNRLTFRMMGPLQASHLLNVLRDYAGGAKPFVLRLGGAFTQLADGTALADGTKIATGDFQCRLYDAPELVQVAFRKYELTLNLAQDLI